MVTFLLEIIAGAIIIFISWKKNKTMFGNTDHEISVKNIPFEKDNFLAKCCYALLFILFVFLLLYKVDEIPAPFYVDEAGSAYDAFCLVNYGVDRFLERNPVIFLNFGGHGQNALYTYLAAISIKLFGFSYFTVRLPAIVLSILSAVCFSWLIRKESGDKAALIIMGLFCILPFSIMHSRWGLEAHIFFPMLLLSCTGLHTAVRSRKGWMFAVSGIMFGLTLYTYAISYIVLPVFLGIYLAVLLFMKRITWINLMAMGIPLFIFAFPLMLMLAINYGLMDEIKTSFITIPKLFDFHGEDMGIKNIPENLKLNTYNIVYRLLVDDKRPWNSIRKYGALYYFSLPFLLLGLFISAKSGIKALKNRTVAIDLLMLSLFPACVFTSLLLVSINMTRCCEIYVPLIYFLFRGIFCVTSNSRNLSLGVFGVFFVLFLSFSHFYFTEYPEIMLKTWGSYPDFKEAVSFTESINQKKDDVFVFGYYGPYIFTLLALEMDPHEFVDSYKMDEESYITGFNEYHFALYTDWDNFPDNCIYIFRNERQIPWQIDLVPGLEKQRFGTVNVFYPSGLEIN